MKLDQGSRNVVLAIDRNGGEATTTEIRRATGLTNSSVRYRYGKLEDLGLVETERDPDATPDGVAAVTVASLTDIAREEIDKGLTVEAAQERAHIEPNDNYEHIKALEGEIAQLRHLVNALDATQDDIIGVLKDTREQMR